MSRRGIVQLLLLGASTVALWTAALPAGAVPGGRAVPMQSLEAGVLADVNALRRAHGMGALRLSPALSNAARQHSMEMATRGYFAHNSANGVSFDKRIARFYSIGFNHFWSVGENLLWSSPDVDPPRAVTMWMNSPEHRANLLNPAWREIGLSGLHLDAAPGAYGGQAVTILTADFGVRR